VKSSLIVERDKLLVVREGIMRKARDSEASLRVQIEEVSFNTKSLLSPLRLYLGPLHVCVRLMLVLMGL
jgi:hypothetical protein